MTDRALDDLARRVLLDAIRLEYHDLIEELPEYDFSPSFERKMQKLIRRANHPIRHRIVQTAACLLLVVLLSGCSVLAFSPQAREAFVGWIRELQQEWFSYHYTGEIEEGPRNTVYYPVWLPEGYREIIAPELGTFVNALYENENGSLLSFSYQVGIEPTTFHVEWENTELRQTAVLGAKADLYQNAPGNANVLVWTDETLGIVFWLTAPLAEEDLVRIAESIQESEPMDWVYRPTWLPGPVALVDSSEENGEGKTVYETGEGNLITFCYSKSGITPYAEWTDGQNVTLEHGSATLYSMVEGDIDTVLTWTDTDTGYSFWLVSEMTLEDMVKFAESVKIYTNTINSALEREPFGDDLIMGPPCEKVEQALTDELTARIKAYAERDAEVNIYMQDDYPEMIDDYMEAYISPGRESMINRVSELAEEYAGVDKPPSSHVLCLIEPFGFASINTVDGHTTAHIYDIYGYMIASYNSSGDSWFSLSTLEELQFGYAASRIYGAAYQEARATYIVK